MLEAASPIAAWSYGLAAVAYSVFAAYLLRRGFATEGPKSRATLMAIGLSAVWAATGAIFGFAGGFVFLVLGAAADVLRYGALYGFLLALMRSGAQPVTGRWLRIAAWAILFAGVALQTMRIAGLSFQEMPRLILFQGMAMVVLAVVLLEQLLRNVDADSQWNVKPLLLGLGGVFLFDLYYFSDALLFGRFDADVFNVRGLIHALVVPLLAISVVRSGSQLSKVRLSQKAAFHSTTLMLVGLYLLFMALVGYYVRFFGGEWGRAMQYAVLFVAAMLLVAVLVSGSMRAKLRVLVGKHFFRYRYDYREEWLRFTNALAAQHSIQGMGEQVIRGLANMVESPGGGLWLRDGSTGRMTQIARWNMPRVVDEEDADSSLCRFLRDSGWVVNLAEFRSITSRYQGLELPEWLSQMDGAWLVVPLVAGNEMIGLVVLGRPRTDVEVDWEVNDLLKTAGRQAASFLAQVLAAEELIESRKFDAFNRMSAFVVHDLKNIITQLALLVKNAERHGDNPEFQKDMLMTVQNSVERMRQLMLQLREGATPAGTFLGVSLGDIAQAMGAARAAQGRPIEVTVSEAVVARGHADRIERVIGHAVQNALDATDPSGRVWVIVDREGGRGRVVVGDTGHGMSPDFIRERLFKPFQTTKKSGMGIGAYESFQYVRSLGGDVRVESREGIGTVITLLFPLFEGAPGAPLSERVGDGQ
jgi:putative PEP-CTERM system histidine kinase